MSRLLKALTILTAIAGIAAILKMNLPQIIKPPRASCRELQLIGHGWNGRAPQEIVVMGGKAYTINQNGSISAVDLVSGRVTAWRKLRVPQAFGGCSCTTEGIAWNWRHPTKAVTDGNQLYIAVPGFLYALDRQTLKTTARLKFPMSIRQRLACRGETVSVVTLGLKWHAPDKSLYALVAYRVQPCRDKDWLVLYRIKPVTLEIARSTPLDLRFPGKQVGAAETAGPFFFFNTIGSPGTVIVDGGAGKELSILKSPNAFTLSYVTAGNPSRLYLLTNEDDGRVRYVSVANPTTGQIEDRIPLPALGTHPLVPEAVMVAYQAARRIVIAVQSKDKIMLTVLRLDTRKATPWYTIPAACSLGGMDVDWDTGVAYITDMRNHCVRLLNVDPVRYVGQIPVGVDIRRIWFDRKRKKLFAQGQMGGQKLWSINTSTGRLENALDLHEEKLDWDECGEQLVNVDLDGGSFYAQRRPAKFGDPFYYEKHELTTGRRIQVLDDYPLYSDRAAENPTVFPRAPADEDHQVEDRVRHRLYQVRYEPFAWKADNVEVWATDTHKKVGDISVAPFNRGYLSMTADWKRNRLYLAISKEIRIIDTVMNKEIGTIPIPGEGYSHACANEATGHLFLLPAPKTEMLEDESYRVIEDSRIVRIFDPRNHSQQTFRLPPNWSQDSAMMASDPSKAEVYVFYPGSARLLILRDKP